jgi:hypothetical protein
VLSLYLPSPHAALYDRGKFISCTGSVPSPMTLALRRKPNGSALPKFPSSVSDGGWFRGFTGSLLRCGLSSCSPPCTDLTRHFSQPTGTFTPELPTSRSPFSSSGITTVAPERLHRWDFHPLERQLASLHRLFHPLLHAGLSRRTAIGILRQLAVRVPQIRWNEFRVANPSSSPSLGAMSGHDLSGQVTASRELAQWPRQRRIGLPLLLPLLLAVLQSAGLG